MVVVVTAETTLAAVLAAAMAVMTGAVMMAAAMTVMLAVMVEAAVKAMTVAVVAEMKTGFSSKSPPRLPGAKHPAFAPAPQTPLSVPARLSFGTPSRRNSDSVRAHAHSDAPPSSTVRSAMDILLFNEHYGKVVFDVENMWQTFGSADNDQMLLCAAQELKLYDTNKLKWLGWPAGASEAKVLAWFLNLLETIQTISDSPSPYEFAGSGSLPLKECD